jgi:hypothetical protein
MHHWMPGLFHPLSPVMLSVKTNFDVLCGDSVLSVATITIKKTKWLIPPIISSGGRTFLANILKNTGSTRTAHARRVPCQRCGIYVGLSNIIKPWIIVPSKNATCAHVVIQAKTYEDEFAVPR